MARHKVVDIGAEVNWPKGEKIPGNMQEALALGWEVTGRDCEDAAADESSERGTVNLEKTTARHRLYLRIPYEVAFTHGKPYSPKAHTAKVRHVTTEQIRAALDAHRQPVPEVTA